MKSVCLPQLEKSPNSTEDPVGGCVTNFSRRKETQIISLLPFVIFKVLIYYLVAKSCPTLPLHGLQRARLPCASLSPRVNLVSIELVLPSNHLNLCCLLLLPSIFPSIRVFSSESALRIRWPKDWSFSISPSSEYSVLISFRMDWFDPLAAQGTLRSLQHHSSKASILCRSAFMVPTLTSIHDYWKNHSFEYTDLCWQNDVFDTLSRFVIAFLQRSKHLLISCLQSSVIWSPKK